ncbi:MAG: ABC transporter permease [Gemmatimonadota bacterium]
MKPMERSPLARTLLRLYPPHFRERFAAEWEDIVAWHWKTRDASLRGTLRFARALVADALRTLPGAWWEALMTAARGQGPLGSDLRHALRGLRRNPGFAGAALLSVSLGIAVNSAMFSVVDAVLLRPLPYAASDRLAMVWNAFPGAELSRLPMSGVEIESLREESQTFEQVAGIWATSTGIEDSEGRVLQVSHGLVTPDFFDLLQVEPTAGHFFVREPEQGPQPTGVVLSYELWRDHFGANPAILESGIRLRGQTLAVYGILPADFTLFLPEDGAVPPRLDLYSALPWDLTLLPPNQHFLRVVARLHPGVSADEASSAAATAAERVRGRYPVLQDTGDTFTVHPLQADAVRAARPVLLALLGAVGLFLLLACTNVASLILARSISRMRELAIRASLGASGASILRLLITESLLITGFGAVLGLVAGRAGVAWIWSMRPAGLARAEVVALDGRVVTFAAALAVATGLIFAAVSAFAARTLRPQGALGSGTRLLGGAGTRMRELLTAVQIAIGVVLVVGSALMVQSFSRLGRESVGFDPRRAITFKTALSAFGEDERLLVVDELTRRLQALPGVQTVGATSHLPFADWANWADAAPPQGTAESEANRYFADLRSVTPGLLSALGAELRAGRLLDEHDDGSAQSVVVIDETMAARAFPDGDAVGRSLVPSRYREGGFQPTPAVVVGVIRDLRDRSPSRPSEGQVFWPYAQSPRWELTWFVRTAGVPALSSEQLLREAQAVRPELTVSDVRPMESYARQATALTRFLALVGSAFALVALTVAALGLYGVVTFVTLQRTPEFGMRIALGASARRVLSGVLRQGVRIGALGVTLGVVLSISLARYLESLVYGVEARDPLTVGSVAALLLVVALVSSMGPALRATRTDPAIALREL